MLDFDAFATLARDLVAAVPEEFREGIDSVDVDPDARPDPHLPDVYLLGLCETSPLSDPSGQEPLRSVIHLYYGSFAALAEADPRFDVRAELEEVVHHEIQHHVEDRAGAHTLQDEDDLFEAHARFRAGLEVPAGWYRQGETLEEGLWAVDLDLFLEVPLRLSAWERLRGSPLDLTVLGERVSVDVPGDAEPNEVWTFEGEGLIQEEEWFDDEEDEDEETPEDGEDETEVEEAEADDDEDVPPGHAGDLHVIPIVR